jgi:NADPH:quinone reductase-like Zn-dependent oxidoreductase
MKAIGFTTSLPINEGTNAELHLVDERIVGRKPAALSHTEAAVLPLTSLTVWEAIFDRMHVPDMVEVGSMTGKVAIAY